MTHQHATAAMSRPRQGQQGAATLIVVMLLFFIISMVAAYTSRNLIFEQRTSANQYRTTQAFEASEAGLEWALGQLNAGRTTNTCAPSTDDASATDQSFAQRYLTVNASTGVITPRAASGGGAVLPMCVFDSSSGTPANWTWKCACPVATAGTAGLAPPGGTGPAPAFIVRLRRGGGQVGARTDLIQLDARSCTRLDTAACVTFAIDDRGGSGDGVAGTGVMLALRGAVTRPPAGALTVAGSLAALPGGATLLLSNQETTASGLTLHTGGNVPALGVTLRGLPGTPPANSAQSGDASLAPAAAGGYTTQDRRFAQFFGVRPATYFGQPQRRRARRCTGERCTTHGTRKLDPAGRYRADCRTGGAASGVGLERAITQMLSVASCFATSRLSVA